MIKEFPTDIDSILQMGMGKWAEGYFCPVSEDEFHQIWYEILSIFVSEIENCPDQEIRDILTVGIKLFVEIADTINAKILLDRINSRNMRPVYRQSSKYFKGLYENGIPNFVHEGNRPVIARKNIITEFKAILRNQKYRYLLNSKSLIKSLNSLNSNHIVFVIQENITKFIYDNNISCQYINYVNLFSGYRQNQIPYDLEQKIVQVAKELFNKISAFYSTIRHSVDSFLDKGIYDWLLRELFEYVKFYCQAKKIYKGKRYQCIYLGSLGNPMIRALGLVAKRQNCLVRGFSHGNSTSMYMNEIMSIFEWPVIDEYFVPTQAIQKACEKVKTKFPPVNNSALNIISQNYTGYASIYINKFKNESTKQIKRIMLIGFPMNYWRGPRGLYAPNQAYLEHQAIKSLISNGYEVIYKMHPDRIHEKLHSEFNITKILESFESINVIPDAYFFLNIETSVFTLPFFSDIPIVFLDMPFNPWQPEHFTLISKRCGIFNGYYDDNNRINFHESDMLNAIEESVKLRNNKEYIEKYFISSHNIQ